MGGHLSHLEREPHSDDNVLQASCGPVRGNAYKHDDKIVDGYLGIPYAEPVVRFQKSEPALYWRETRDCTKYGPVAPPSGISVDAIPKELQKPYDEANCLTINVFSPRWENKEYKSDGRPVMVYIHGGGFEFGSSADYDDYSISGTLPLKDVVVVTFNYRLGILGFFTTGDKTCRGNFGLWDQTLALQWVQKHIRSFGGNPGNVTVFGQSAGGASTDFMSLSPHSRDLFQKFVPMSGSAMCDFAIRTPEVQASVFEQFAKHKGYDGSDSASLLEWYKTQSPSDLMTNDGFKLIISGGLYFVPNLDGDFFPKPIEKLRKASPKKPMLTGVCEHESLMFAFMNPFFTTPIEELKNLIATVFNDKEFDDAVELQNSVYEYYTKDLEEGDEDGLKKRLVEFSSDVMFNIGVFDSARSAAKHGSDVYLYTFAYFNEDGFGNFKSMLPFTAATHCSELRFLLGEGVISKFEPNEQDLKMIDKMTRLFSNFAKYGNPNEAGSLDWYKHNPANEGQHYKITGDEEGNESGMVEDYHGGRWKFLDELRLKNKIRKGLIN